MGTIRPISSRLLLELTFKSPDSQGKGLTICQICQTHLLSVSRRPTITIVRAFSTRSRILDEKSKIENDKSIKDKNVHDVNSFSGSKLPSHREATRYTLTKRTHALLDDLMQRLAGAGQRINNYTGTDYTGIEALRREIKLQEQLVKSRRDIVATAKLNLDKVDTERVASQKAVVALLERKNSWSSADLERYMSLIRSEHAHDQAVQAAKDAIAESEQALEEARQRLEKRERAQYHEEQIWSDTIRRNSSWVTFGLMGVNLAILLINLVIVEPWRRKRLVGEVKAALDGKTVVTVETVPTIMKDGDVDATIADALAAPVNDISVPGSDDTMAAPIAEIDSSIEGISDVVSPLSVESIEARVRGLFSDQTVLLTQLELTKYVLEALAAGIAITSGFLYMSRR